MAENGQSRAASKVKDAVENTLPAVLQEAFGNNLHSVVVYGSYVAGNFTPGVSDVNVLVLLTDPAPRSLHALSRKSHRFLSRHNVTPLVLSVREFQNSADVFPVEYLDILARHTVLYGEDILGTMTISRANLRHELEHQLRGSLVSLRQLVIASRGQKRALGRRLKAWYGQMAALFRGLLRLAGADDVPLDPAVLLSRMNEVYGLTPGPFTELLEFRGGAKKDPEALLEQVLVRLSELVRIVDEMEKRA